MANNSKLFAPPTEEELSGDLFAPPTDDELSGEMFAPPTEEELTSVDDRTGKVQSFSNTLGKLVEPLTTKQQEFDLETRYQAGKELEETQENTLTGSQTEKDIGNALSVMANEFTFGATTEAKALLRSITEDMDWEQARNMEKAILRLRKEQSPKSAFVGTIMGYLGPSGAAKAAAKMGAKKGTQKAAAIAEDVARGAVSEARDAEEGREMEAVTKSLMADALIGGTFYGVGKGIKKIKGDPTKAKADSFIEKNYSEIADNAKILHKGKQAADDEFIEDLRDIHRIAVDSLKGDGKRLQWENLPQDKLKDLYTKYEDKELTQQLIDKGINAQEAILESGKTTLKSKLSDFGKQWVDPDASSSDVIRKMVRNTESIDRAEKAYRDFSMADSYNKAASEALLAKGVLTGNLKESSARGVMSFLSDFKLFGDHLENLHGLPISQAINDLSRAVNKTHTIMHDLGKKHKKLFKALRAVEKSPVLSKKFIKAIESDDIASLPVNQQKLAEGVKEYFDDVVKSYEELGIKKFLKRENYIPAMAVNRPEYLFRIQKKSDELLKRLGIPSWRMLMEKDLKDLPDELTKEIDEFRKGLVIGGVSRKSASNPRGWDMELSNVRAKSQGELGDSSLKLGALEMRQDTLPDFLRETSISRLMSQNPAATLQGLQAEDSIRQLKIFADAMEKRGDDLGAKRVREFLQDFQGQRQGTIASWLRNSGDTIRLAAKHKADQTNSKFGKKIYSVLETLPDITTSLTYNLYPNFIGWKPALAMRNLTQGPLLTLPEYANWKSGNIMMAKAMAKASADIFSGKATKELLEEGLMPAKFTGEMREFTKNELQKHWIGRASSKALETAADAAMFLYSKSDVYNRLVTKRFSEEIVKKVQKGDKAALEFVGRLPRQVRKQVRSSPPKEQFRLITDYLNANTQFNYNKATMAEFARAGGPMFSMFSKWPSAIAGDMLGKYLNGEGKQALLKYLGPYVVASTMLAGGMYLNRQEDPRLSKIIPSGDPRLMTPGSSLESVLTGEVGSPPVIDSFTTFMGNIKDLPRAIQNRELDNWWKKQLESTTPYIPGHHVYRLLFKELPEFTTNRPYQSSGLGYERK